MDALLTNARIQVSMVAMIADYHGSGIVNLMASLQRGLGGRPHAYRECGGLEPARVSAHAKVFLLVIDGLGFDYLRRRPAAAWLNAHCSGALSSVYPPTTSAAITTFLTGDAPAQHAMVGWFLRFAEFPEVFAVLPGHARGGGRALAARVGDLRRFLGHRGFAERIRVPAHVVSPAHIAHSPYNLAHLGPAELHAFEGLEGLVGACAAIARRPGPAYVYAYWHGLDAVGHASGMESGEASIHLAAIDAALARLHEALRGTGSLLVVTADHGHLDTTPADRHLLNHYRDVTSCLDGPVSGEPRTVYCHLAAGASSRFEGLVCLIF
jgi:hypothetical protein